MAAPALALQALPEAEEIIETASSEAKEFAYEVARQAGLTAEDDYRGWIPVFILLYRFVYPPVALALQIESQVSGVLEAAYHWLGQVGEDATSFEAGITARKNALKAKAAALGKDIEVDSDMVVKFFEGL